MKKVKITFVDKDAPLAIKIQEVFGAGTLEYPCNTKYVNLLFQDVNLLFFLKPPHVPGCIIIVKYWICDRNS